ncbi:uncharacterized protein LOC131942962 [Physella acuta]|uniref:uncharacterized protein LOC131942962 n=1 Tax=Physella acuta TaxID=109671 RepID=UPI0027DD9A64|nr:uncharacterized protein LOC131942962 [Physella acuta]XP_059158918.1 uncharacterized protein LOC131942962 [Physella acuta]XP_059158919.1 uncharacterized protein LOC131942962 [Physella acuta]XP_059158920.1 uncharacterized protein LOC131942962 [Physella acuta]
MSQEKCTEICGPGEKCSGDNCVPCDDGSYQELKQHENKSCILWSKKPSGEHWILDKNGTKETDNKYRCADGYYAKEYMPNSWDCFKSEDVSVSTVTPSLNTTVSVLNNSSISPTEATQNVGHADKSTPLSVLVPSITIPGVLVLAVVFIVLICRRKKKLCFRKSKAKTTDAHSAAEMGTLVNSSHSHANGHARTHADDRDYVDGARHISQPYEQFISEIGLPNMERFLHLLENPDEQFNIQRSLNEHKDVNDSSEKYRLVFLDWLNLYKNNPQHREWVKSGLEAIGLPSVYTIFQSESSLDSVF